MRTLSCELGLQIAEPIANFCAVSDVEFPLLPFLFNGSVIELSHPSPAFCQTFFKHLKWMNIHMTDLAFAYGIF